jgi:hypothetical protein
MESRTSISNNINFIQTMSGNATDLRSVIITRTQSNIGKAVSNDHLLAVALAVDDEIAHMERTGVFSTDLLELYRIRYECGHRIAEYLIEQPGIADNPYGKALRGYVYIHASEPEQVNLKKHHIYPVSIPDVTSDVVAHMGNVAYQAFIYYALEYFKTDTQGANSRSLQAQRYANLVNRVKQKHNLDSTLLNNDLLTFTIFDGNPIDANHAADMYEEAVRTTPEITDINAEQLRTDIEPSAMLKELYYENKTLLAKTLSVFKSPGKFISRADLNTKSALAEKLRQENAALKISDMKDGVVMMRYHHDLTNYEHVMNSAALNANKAFADWKTSWDKLSKYAHTAPEFLPNFLDKLETLNRMVVALHQAVLYCREDSMQDKAIYFLELLKTKDAILREQSMIIDSMLARLKLLNINYDNGLVGIVYNSNPADTFYVNLIHHAYQQFLSVQGRQMAIDDRFKREELTAAHIKSFVALIMAKGTPEQQAQLDVMLPNYRVNILESSFSLVQDYSHPEPARPPEFAIDLVGGIVNIDDIAAPDYVSEANKEIVLVNFDLVREKIKEIRGIASSLDLVGLDEAVITENQIAIFDLFNADAIPRDSLYNEFHQLADVTIEDQVLFAKLYIDKYVANKSRVNERLLIEILHNQVFMDVQFNHHIHFFIDDFVDASQMNDFPDFQAYEDYRRPLTFSDDESATPNSQLLEEAPTPKKLNFIQRNPWFKYALIGFAIAAVVAVAIFVSVSTFGAGAAPGLLAVGGTIGLAVGASAGSAATVGLALLGTVIAVGAGFIGAAIAVGFRAIVAKFKSKKAPASDVTPADEDYRPPIVSQKQSTGVRPAGNQLFPAVKKDKEESSHLPRNRWN